MSLGQDGPDAGGGPGRRVVEVVTAVAVTVVVASGVVAVGVTTQGDDDGNVAGPGADETPNGTPTPTQGQETDEPQDETGDGTDNGQGNDDTGGEDGEELEPEVTNVELRVDQPEYTGACPVTLTFTGRITTNTGPFEVDFEWQDETGAEVEGNRVQFGGPGPQGADVTHTVEVHDDGTVERTLETIDPNVVTSNTVTANVTCTPEPEITKGGDTFTPGDPEAGVECTHSLRFDATITVPRNMTVTYEWLRSDGATDSSGPHSVNFTGGGMQTQTIPSTDWKLTGDTHVGAYGRRIHILEPYDVTSDRVAYNLDGCSGPAT